MLLPGRRQPCEDAAAEWEEVTVPVSAETCRQRWGKRKVSSAWRELSLCV